MSPRPCSPPIACSERLPYPDPEAPRLARGEHEILGVDRRRAVEVGEVVEVGGAPVEDVEDVEAQARGLREGPREARTHESGRPKPREIVVQRRLDRPVAHEKA